MSVKGDWSRVKDTESYRSNYDNIFRKNKEKEPQKDEKDKKEEKNPKEVDNN
jgi:hypothetical protein